jgi:hypothetical protein
MMTLMAVCGALVVIGLIAVVRWGASEVRPPATGEPSVRSPRAVARRYVWYLTLAVVSGVGSGVLIAGAGGRLAMRLLAATAGDAAQGRETEAEEIVGRVSAGGTIGFIIFVALFFGLATGALYLLIRRWLPDGRLGGVVYGLLLLVLVATRVDPLRADNPDFDIVGPGWAAVLVFGALVVVHGMLVAAIAGRYSNALPLISRERRSLLAYAPLLVVLPVAPAAVFLLLIGVVIVLLSRSDMLIQFLSSRSAALGGRVALVAVTLVSLPGCLSALSSIAGRTP